VRPTGVLRQRRIGWACAITAGALLVVPLTAAATTEHGSSRATTAAGGLTITLGTVYGGVTAQGFPVVIETSTNGRKIVRATIAIRLSCTSGGAFTTPDRFAGMRVSKKRKFNASFGPTTNRNDDGTTTDGEGRISGAFNKSRTRASGKWSFKIIEHDAAGAITDTCDSGSISWTAKQ
jgi:hypothetical protein